MALSATCKWLPDIHLITLLNNLLTKGWIFSTSQNSNTSGNSCKKRVSLT